MDKIAQLSPLALAFVGDSVHTLFVRQKIVDGTVLKINDYHKASAYYCKAETQSRVMEKIVPILFEDEQEIARKARNAKIHHTAKNSSIKDYKQATSFEAIIGFLYLSKKYNRLNELLEISVGEDIW